MKKITLAVLVLLLVATSSHAQFRAGVKGGANLSSIDMSMQSLELEIYKPRVGFHAGLMAEYMFSRHFGLHTELMYFNSGANIAADKYLQGVETPDGVEMEGHVSMNTFQLPLYMKTKFMLTNNLKLYVMGGGFATYSPEANQHIRWIGGGESMKVKWSLFDPKIKIMGDEESNLYMQQRFNAGVAVEAGIEMNQIVVGVGFRQVLNNMAALEIMGIGKPTTKMWTANLSVGYYF